MAVRNCRFELRLSQEELNNLTEKADRAGISKADFVRKGAYHGQKAAQNEKPDIYGVLCFT